MGIFDKLFGGKKQQEESVAVADNADCQHTVLVARWENVQDMGHEDKASRYMCETCHEMFSPDQARELQDAAAKRLAAALQETGTPPDEERNS